MSAPKIFPKIVEAALSFRFAAEFDSLKVLRSRIRRKPRL